MRYETVDLAISHCTYPLLYDSIVFCLHHALFCPHHTDSLPPAPCQAAESRTYGNVFSDFELLSLAYLALGPSGFPNAHPDVNFTTLLAHAASLSLSGKLNLLYAYQRRALTLPAAVSELLPKVRSQLRVPGQMAYVAATTGSKVALSHTHLYLEDIYP